jgi:hypothetical protein
VPDRQTSTPTDWAARLLGPLGGLLVIAAVLVMSFFLDELDGSQLLKSLLGVAITATLAVAVFYLLLDDRIGDMIAKAIRAEDVDRAAHLTETSRRLEQMLQELERVLNRETIRLAESIELDDSQLATLEASDVTSSVMICRQEMGDEFAFDDPSSVRFEQAVETNLARGVAYTWVTEDNAISRRRAKGVQGRFSGYEHLIHIHLVSSDVWRTLPFSFEVVFLVQSVKRGSTRLLGYADVSFGIASARAWRRLDERKATEWYDQADQIASNVSSVVLG